MSTSTIPADLRYTKDHEWLRLEGDVATVGITHHAQEQLGDVVFVELPEPGTSVEAGAALGTVESVKAVSDLFAPVTGEVVEVNAALEQSPELVNSEPYGAGWMVKLKPTKAADVDALLDAEAYAAQLENEG